AMTHRDDLDPPRVESSPPAGGVTGPIIAPSSSPSPEGRGGVADGALPDPWEGDHVGRDMPRRGTEGPGPGGSPGLDRSAPRPPPRSFHEPGLVALPPVGHGSGRRGHLGCSPPPPKLRSRPPELEHRPGQGGSGYGQEQEGRDEDHLRPDVRLHGSSPRSN